ncbi:MAG: RnfH family protein [Pseudohongiella sp.]|nr:RnfH family protein [Pseudohongiella sp.]
MIHIQWLALKPSDGGVLTKAPATLELPAGSTAAQALKAIGLNDSQITALLNQRAVAVYGLYATENTVLHDGDRLEILDEQKFDPMESRRRRAQHKVLTKRQKELAKYERRSRKQGKTNT